jgi:hypothetical protein
VSETTGKTLDAGQTQSETSGQPQGQTSGQAQGQTSGQAQGQASGQAEGQTQTADNAKSVPVELKFDAPQNVTYEPVMLGEFKSFAAEQKFNQSQVDGVLKLAVKMQEQAAQAQEKAWSQQLDTWAEEAEKDSELTDNGKPGAFDKNAAIANEAFKKFAPPELATWLQQTGLGGHPLLVKTFYRIGKAMADDTFAYGAPAVAPKSLGETLFDGK